MVVDVMRVMIVTGSRSEYGLLEPLVNLIHTDPAFTLQLIVTGSHLSHEYGMTVEKIHFPIAEKIEILLSSDTAVGTSKAMGLALISFAEALDRLKPDVVVILGDRFESFACASAAHVAQIPIAHIHGGEITAGAFDDAFRHSITHMATYHFAAADQYATRIRVLLEATGKKTNNIWSVGALGLDGIDKYRQLNRSEHRPSFPLLIFHAVTGQTQNETLKQLCNVISRLESEGSYYDYILGNADPRGKEINDIIKAYTIHGDCQVSLSRASFLKMLASASYIVGNSSCGIIEAPALGIPTINVGDRQQGRLRASSIIDCDGSKEDIERAFVKLRTKTFLKSLNAIQLQYEGGTVAKRIVDILKEQHDLS